MLGDETLTGSLDPGGWILLVAATVGVALIGLAGLAAGQPATASGIVTETPQADPSPPGASSEATCLAPGMAGICEVQLTVKQGPANEFSVKADRTDPCTLVAGGNDYVLRVGNEPSGDDDHEELQDDVWAGYYTSHDCGRTWNEGLVPGYPGGPESALSDYNAAGDPVMLADGDGDFYYVGIAFNRSPTVGSIFIAESTDGGDTFDETALVHRNEDGLDDKPWAAVDPANGDLFVTWTMFGGSPGGIVFTKSTDGDLDFTEPKRLCQSSCGQGSQIVVAPDGTLHVVWASISSGELWYTRSEDRGESWTQPERIATYDGLSWYGEAPFRTPTAPILAVDRSGGPTHGNLYVAVQAEDDGADAYVLASRDGGDTWTDLVKANGLTRGDQFFPTVSAGPHGHVHVMWMDYTDDGVQHRMATSTDAGESFQDGEWLTSTAGAAHDFMGDYQGIVTTERAVHPVFIDTRDGRRDALTTLRTKPPALELADTEGRVGEAVPVTVDATATTTLEDAELTVRVPGALEIADAGGATVDEDGDATVLTWTRAELLRTRTWSEGFQVTGAAPGNYSLEASLSASGLTGEPVQAAAGGTVRLLAPQLEAAVEAPEAVDAGEAFPARLTVTNTGNLDAPAGHANLTAPEGYLLEPGFVTITGDPGVAMVYGEPRSRPQSPQNPATRPATTVTWELPALEPGEETGYRLDVRAPPEVVLEPEASVFHGLAVAGDGEAFGTRDTATFEQLVHPLVAAPGG